MRTEGQCLGTATRSWSRPGAASCTRPSPGSRGSTSTRAGRTQPWMRSTSQRQRDCCPSEAAALTTAWSTRTATVLRLFIPPLENISRTTKWRICGYYCWALALAHVREPLEKAGENKLALPLAPGTAMLMVRPAAAPQPAAWGGQPGSIPPRRAHAGELGSVRDPRACGGGCGHTATARRAVTAQM